MNNRSTVTLASNGRYWQAFYQDSAGRRRAKSLGPKHKLSRRQAKILCDRLAADHQLNPAKAGSQAPPLETFLDSYIKGRTDLKPASWYLQELTCRYLKQHFGRDIRIDRITRSMAAGWRTALAAGELKDARDNHQYQIMNETSVCRRTGDAKAIFNHAVRDDLIPYNRFDRLRSRPSEPDKDWHYVSMEQLDKLCAVCPNTGWQLLIALCRLAGLRRGEAVALRWDAVDWDNHRLKVIAEKTGRRRLVPVESKLHAMLLQAHEQAPEQQTLVCDVNALHLWRNFTVIRKRAGLPPWEDAFQVLRRNCETDWAQKYPQYAVSVWIGHDITVSARHYLQVPEELYQKVTASAPIASPQAIAQ
jgi:integrase